MKHVKFISHACGAESRNLRAMYKATTRGFDIPSHPPPMRTRVRWPLNVSGLAEIKEAGQQIKVMDIIQRGLKAVQGVVNLRSSPSNASSPSAFDSCWSEHCEIRSQKRHLPRAPTNLAEMEFRLGSVNRSAICEQLRTTGSAGVTC
ncbi:hypothetical protein Y032_0079g1267 [Ancylostoma ceylanicum]|nr:hypothetical protein Y032_0079g1267 [Ancylostoma ceylanicum]